MTPRVKRLTNIHVSRDSLVHKRDMTHPYVWHDSSICVTWLIHVWHDSSICVAWLTHEYAWHDTIIRDMTPRVKRLTNPHVDSFSICVTWLIHMCDMTHSSMTWLPVWNDSLIHMWIPSPYVWHDSSICVTWLTHPWHDSPCETTH